MKTIGLTRTYFGSFSTLLNDIKEIYPNIKYRHKTFKLGIVLNVPDIYNITEVMHYIGNKYKYNIQFRIDKTKELIITV